MPRLLNSSTRIQIGLRGWAAIAASLIILIAVPVVIAFFAIGLLVFLLPAMLLVPLIHYFMPKSKPIHRMRASADEKLIRPTTIDGTFRVTEMTTTEENSDGNGRG
jgi:hypothetical protein